MRETLHLDLNRLLHMYLHTYIATPSKVKRSKYPTELMVYCCSSSFREFTTTVCGCAQCDAILMNHVDGIWVVYV